MRKDPEAAAEAQSIHFNRECFLPAPYLVSCLLKECHPVMLFESRCCFRGGQSFKGNPCGASSALCHVNPHVGAPWFWEMVAKRFYPPVPTLSIGMLPIGRLSGR